MGADVSAAFTGLRVVSTVTLALWVVVGVIERIWELPLLMLALAHGGPTIENARNRVRLCLMGNSFANIAMSATCAALAFNVPFSGSAETCDVVGRLLGVWYSIAVQCCYLFLCERARIVRRLLNGGFWYSRLAMFLYWGTSLGVPCGLVALVVVFGKGVVLPGGGCTLKESVPWIAISFAVCDFLLTMGLLLLFIVPLRNQAATIHAVNPHSALKLRRLSIKSIYASTLTLAATLGAILLAGYIFSLPDSDYRKNALLITAIFVLVGDLTVNGLVCKALTTAWLSAFLVKRIVVVRTVDRSKNVPSFKSKARAIADRATAQSAAARHSLPEAGNTRFKLQGSDAHGIGTTTSNPTMTTALERM